MLARTARIFGGYAFSRRDLRLLYAAAFLSILGASITFPLRLLYAQQHHASPAEIGIMAGSFLLAPLLVQLPMGWLVDRWGRVPVLLVALIGHPILSLLYIMFNSPIDLITLRFLEGVTIAAFQPALSAYIADVTPQEHRSEAYGALGATFNAALLVGPLVGGVIGQYFGFTAAFIVNVIIEAVAIPLVLGTVHEPRIHRASSEDGPLRWRYLLTLPLITVYVSFFCVQVVMGTLVALWAIWLHDTGGSYTYIGLTFTVFALPQIFFGAGAGRMADRWGRGRFLLVSGIAAGCIYASYGFVTNLALIMLLGVVEGLAIVFQQPVVQGFLADASPAEARGRAQGIAGATGAIGGSAAAFGSLPLYHLHKAIPFVLTGGVMVVGAVIVAAGAMLFTGERRAAQLQDELRTA